MNVSAPKILLTGPPGCGKTTVVKRVVDRISLPARGFFTEEVRGRDGRRIGFDVVMLDGRRGALARVDSGGPRVGKYGVCLGFLETVVLAGLQGSSGGVLFMDEIGKMECCSAGFKEAVRSALSGESFVIGTVALGGSAFIREVRSREDVELMEVAAKNREGLVQELIKRLDVYYSKFDV